jgi:hypothetical protein
MMDEKALEKTPTPVHPTAQGDNETPPSTSVEAPITEFTLPVFIKPQERKTHDPDVLFEEYHYYALKTREEEDTLVAPSSTWREVVLRKKNPAGPGNDQGALEPSGQLTEANFANVSNRLDITDEEWTNASRAFRTASWGACE